MDLEKALRAFAQSDMPLRQTREEINLKVRVWDQEAPDRVWTGYAQDLSRGGLGVALTSDGADLKMGREMMLEILLPEDSADGEEVTEVFSAPTKVAWLKLEKGALAGLEFQELGGEQRERLERYLLSQIIRRTIDEA